MRPSLEQIYMLTARLLSLRSRCLRLRCGIVIATEDLGQIVAIGFNGGPIGGFNQCKSLEPGQCGHLHAEINSCISNQHIGPKKVFISHNPCANCAVALVNLSKRLGPIVTIYYEKFYRNVDGLKILEEAGIPVIQFNPLSSFIKQVFGSLLREDVLGPNVKTKALAHYFLHLLKKHHLLVDQVELQRLMYLADWKTAIETEQTITTIVWEKYYFGPTTVGEDSNIMAKILQQYCETKKVDRRYFKELSVEERKFADFVFDKFANQSSAEFFSLISSTYPMVFNHFGAKLNLPILARDYVDNVMPLLRAKND